MGFGLFRGKWLWLSPGRPLFGIYWRKLAPFSEETRNYGQKRQDTSQETLFYHYFIALKSYLITLLSTLPPHQNDSNTVIRAVCIYKYTNTTAIELPWLYVFKNILTLSLPWFYVCTNIPTIEHYC